LTRNNAAASLLPAAVASASYDAANEQTAFAGATLTYDANGNLTNDGTNTYVWDARNRLVSISGGATATFNYDALGRRVQKTLNTQSTVLSTGFLYDGNDIAAEIGGSAVGASYLRSLIIDEPFVRQAGTGNEYYHTDALGSSLALSNTQGVSGTMYTYEAFGKTTVTGTSANALQFTGRENDGAGLYYYRARYYSPRFQRFISEDPTSFFGGDLNLYAYVKNKPLEFRDSRGTFIDTLTDLGFIGYDLYRIAIDGRKDFGSNLTALGLDATGAVIPFVTGLGVASRAAKNLPDSPIIDPKSIAGKSPGEIDSYAKKNGLIPKGPDPMSGKGAYIDPVTGEQRVLVHPNDSKCGPHCHVNDPNGQRLDINGQAVLPESPGAHLPLKFPYQDGRPFDA
jgi:RHS repeat-associated protein